MYSWLRGSVKLTPWQLATTKIREKKCSKVVRKSSIIQTRSILLMTRWRQDFLGHLGLAFHVLLGCGVGRHYSPFPLMQLKGNLCGTECAVWLVNHLYQPASRAVLCFCPVKNLKPQPKSLTVNSKISWRESRDISWLCAFYLSVLPSYLLTYPVLWCWVLQSRPWSSLSLNYWGAGVGAPQNI